MVGKKGTSVSSKNEGRKKNFALPYQTLSLINRFDTPSMVIPSIHCYALIARTHFKSSSIFLLNAGGRHIIQLRVFRNEQIQGKNELYIKGFSVIKLLTT